MSKNEQMRIAMLKSVRNENNCTVIDQAIKDGMTFEELVRSMANNRGSGAKAVAEVLSLNNDLRAIQEAEQIDSIVASINESRGGQARPVSHMKLTNAEETLTDEVAAAANNHPGRQPLQSQEATKEPVEQSLVDMVADSANQNRQDNRRN